MLQNDIVVDGQPALFALEIVTEPGEGWMGSRLIGEYDTLQDLTKAINAVEVPMYWELKITFVDLGGTRI